MNTPSMTCIINTTVTKYLAKGKKLEVIARYLKMRYKISIDLNVLKKRATSGEFMPVSLG
ncbi:MAG: hypothetical protein WBA74_25485 [Cyclobacteriaceae bacterium]